MRYASVCSGIEAASVAWKPLGWIPAVFCEIERFPSAVLKHHYPAVPNHGDFTTLNGDEYGAIDLLVGGTPCQDFSVAGLRAGMDGKRGQLTVEFARLAGRMRPRWLVWENVPGVLSVDGGRAFGTFFGLLGQLGYGFAYRILDAQYAGIPQRRRRVYLVGHLGDWRRAAAVLLERHSLSGHPAPRRKTGQSSTYDIAPCLGASGRGFERTGDTRGQDCLVPSTAGTLQASGKAAGSATQQDAEAGLLVAYGGNNCSGPIDVASAVYGPNRLDFESETFLTRPISIQAGCVRTNPESGPDGVGVRTDGIAYTLEARSEVQAVAFRAIGQERFTPSPIAPPIAATTGGGAGVPAMQSAHGVRRLTPRECERLQGFPDDYTLLPGYSRRRTGEFGGNRGVADGPRYKALGNSMAVPVMRWIGARINYLEEGNAA